MRRWLVGLRRAGGASHLDAPRSGGGPRGEAPRNGDERSESLRLQRYELLIDVSEQATAGGIVAHDGEKLRDYYSFF